MHLVGIPTVFSCIAHHTPRDLSPRAGKITVVKCWQAPRQRSLSLAKTSQAISLPRSTLYRWGKQLREDGLEGLEE